VRLGVVCTAMRSETVEIPAAAAEAHLNSLSMVTENVHPNNRLVKFRIGALRDVIIQMLLVPQSIHALEYEFKKSFQVLRAGARNENIRVTMGEGSGNSESQSSGFPSPSRSSQSNGRRKRLLGDSVYKGEDSLGLVESLGKLDELPDRFCIKEGFFQIDELRLLFRFSGSVFQGCYILPA
jgi:hypothetical protein